jgi:hypothetical protein
MRVHVESVNVPAYSSLGYGYGTDLDTGELVEFVGDHRPMHHLGEAVAEGEYIEVELEGWQVLGH